MSIRAFCGLVAAAIILACGLVVLWPLGGLQARAAEPCQSGWMTIAEDKALVAGNPDIQYLGLGHIPYTAGMSVFYRIGPATFFSPVVDGCVYGNALPAGPYRAETAT